MQSHRVLWNVSLSNGENFREGSGRFEETEGGPSPWQQLLKYIEEAGASITALWLSCPNGARHTLPTMGIRDNPKLSAFHDREKPQRLRCFHRIAGDAGADGEIVNADLYTIAEATFKNYKLQIFVSEHDPNVSWVLVVS